jgi:transcription antitermination factor NusA-like protein
MANTINMQDMRHLNLFSQITRIQTRFCVKYNDAIIFCVPKEFVMRALGRDGINIRRMSEILGKRIRIIPGPRGLYDARGFIQTIVKPVIFRDIEIRGDEIIITAGNIQTKAALIGRNKRRLMELQKISKDFFGKELKVI